MKTLAKFLIGWALLSMYSCSRQQTVASVGPEKITVEELNRVADKKAKLLGLKALSPDERRDVLDSMIQRDVVYLYAKEKGIEVSPKEFQDATKVLSLLERVRYRKDVEKNLLFEKMRRNIGNVAGNSSEEIRKYYLSHRNDYTVAEAFKVYLVRVEEADISHVVGQVRKNPEAFDDMALKRVSKDLIDLNKNAPYSPKSDFPREMWPYLEKMKVGDIGGPVTVKKGTFIFKLVDKRPASLKPLSEAYIEINHLLTAQKREDAFQKWYASIKGNYKIAVQENNL